MHYLVLFADLLQFANLKSKQISHVHFRSVGNNIWPLHCPPFWPIFLIAKANCKGFKSFFCYSAFYFQLIYHLLGVRRPLPPVKYSTFRPRQYQSQRDNKPRLPTAIWRVDCNAKCTGRRHAPAGCHLAMCWTRSFMSKKTPLLYARKRAQSTGQGDTRTSAVPPAGCATDGATRPQRHRSCLLHTAQLNLTLALPSWAAPGRLLTVVFSRGDQSYSWQNKRGRRQAGAARFTSLNKALHIGS